MSRTVTPSTGTLTITLEDPSSSSTSRQSHPPQDTLVLRLKRPKKVSWKEGTVDNEFLNRKSSKKCCIFHRQKPFEEDDSDEEDGRGPGGGGGGDPASDGGAGPSHHCCSHGGGHH